ncbi:hypothetical protein CGCF415_v012922 [Colletotrichum fructicola]|uniref:Uncharacterized protein n=1 Tax=Colletotrichum fructicola (strain Nara gc5) TaxID=1213859 RepID=A0A7J6IVN7_COLFN|nr:uncharacterized protein CGMCC3_g17585 [Colletotrichum fructicola]KAF4480640.1 hypothetical protein CGGC5_v011642 [Colletotrichum fructicola Nara gc5]KAI8273678.1 hypothetical protein K4K60_010538 [Colletotrichum sp. SAR11_57]KAE9566242.1 hypothetical protein CGMCC3_g17585 [Colletotrichum fructicola]KAF4426226.1 hypothetical protein CFRS1_v009680 [Colletotrichum fructicola]KAF4888446.1 hypothetical protein CGCFRS4_v009897 [Colletotrichum fructicola]
MPLRETDPDFESDILEKVTADVEAARNLEFAVSEYHLPLPLLLVDELAEKPLPCHEPADETLAISAHLSVRIRAFYNQIAAAYNRVEDPPASLGLKIEIQPQNFDPEEPECYHRRYHSRRLQLHNPETLPDLPFVSRLIIKSRAYGSGAEDATDIRPLSPLVPLQCLVHLPAVQEWTIPWFWERPMPACMPSRVMREHYTWPWEGPLRDARHEFGAAIMDQEKHLCGRRIPAGLTRAALHFWPFFSRPNNDQSVARPNLIHPADKDPVSVGLCKLGAQLSLFDIRAMITPDLFPSPEAPAHQQWSQIRRFRLEFHSLRSDGRWYFVGPGGEDPHDSEEGGYTISDEHYPREIDTEEDDELDDEYGDNPDDEYDYRLDMFRTEPCRQRLEPLLAAFAKSLTTPNMPRLEDAEMFTYLWWDPSNDRDSEKYGLPMKKGHRWGVKFIAGRSDEKDKKDSDAAAAAPTPPVVQWQVGDWRPSDEVMSLFESLGRQEWLNLEWDKYRSTAGRDLLGNSTSNPI